MNGRLYDPTIGRFFSPDPFVADAASTQDFNRYSYARNNPLSYIDPSGEIAWFIPIIIGAVVGGYTGYKVAEAKGYDIGNLKTWGYMLGGAVIGGVSGYMGATIATGGGFMANTMAIVGSSYVNSVGMAVLSDGMIQPSVSFGAASYNFGIGEWGYLGKKGNKWYENLGYGLGALANVSDILMGFHPKNVDLVTENTDAIGHSAIVEEGTKTGVGHGQELDPNGIISVGPNRKGFPDGSWHWMKGTNKWSTYSGENNSRWIQTLKVNYNTIKSYSNWLNKLESSGKLVYSLELSSCVTHTSTALNLSGIFNIGIHPYLLNAQMYLWSNGIRPWTFSYFLNQ